MRGAGAEVAQGRPELPPPYISGRICHVRAQDHRRHVPAGSPTNRLPRSARPRPRPSSPLLANPACGAVERLRCEGGPSAGLAEMAATRTLATALALLAAAALLLAPPTAAAPQEGEAGAVGAYRRTGQSRGSWAPGAGIGGGGPQPTLPTAPAAAILLESIAAYPGFAEGTASWPGAPWVAGTDPCAAPVWRGITCGTNGLVSTM